MHIIAPAPCGPNGLALIGQSRHALMGIRHVEGEGGGAPAPAPAGGEPAPAPAPVPAPAPAPAPTPPAGGAPAPTPPAAEPPAAGEPTGTDAEQLAAKGIDSTGWPTEAIAAAAKAQRDAARFQREAGDARIKSKENAAADERKRVLAELTKVLDPEAAAGAEPTVDSLTTAVTAVGTERDTALRDAALVREAWQQNVDPTKLDYLRFKLSADPAFRASVPTADDFGAIINASVAAQLAADATLKRSGTVTASGVESLGGANGSDAITQERFDAMNMAERSALYTSDKATYDRLAGHAS